MILDIPEDPLYTPTLEIRCFDERLTSKVLLGFANICL
jgi:hypothetical protein